MNPPSYQPVADDGAQFKCRECEERLNHNQVWFVILPNGWRGIICKECLDPQWKQLANYNPTPI